MYCPNCDTDIRYDAVGHKSCLCGPYDPQPKPRQKLKPLGPRPKPPAMSTEDLCETIRYLSAIHGEIQAEFHEQGHMSRVVGEGRQIEYQAANVLLDYGERIALALAVVDGVPDEVLREAAEFGSLRFRVNCLEGYAEEVK